MKRWWRTWRGKDEAGDGGGSEEPIADVAEGVVEAAAGGSREPPDDDDGGDDGRPDTDEPDSDTSRRHQALRKSELLSGLGPEDRLRVLAMLGGPTSDDD